jgi:membrane protease YdiL (CAAX protease family)
MFDMDTTTSTVFSIPFRRWIIVLLALAGVGGMIVIRQTLLAAAAPITDLSGQIDLEVRYQLITAGLALVFLLGVYLLHPQNFRTFARFGDSSAHPEPISWMGIFAKDTWLKVGVSFAVSITLITAIFVYLNVLNSTLVVEKLVVVLPFALIFAASNAFVEEALTRFGIVVSLHGFVPNHTIYLVSALVFGIPHYFGTPGGILGSLMAGYLGWLLAKSIVETRGVFWAWFIHFLLDVVIFSALLSIV